MWGETLECRWISGGDCCTVPILEGVVPRILVRVSVSKRVQHDGLETSTAAEQPTEKFGLDMRSDGGGDVEYGSWFLWRGRNGMDQMAVMMASGAEALGDDESVWPS